MDLKKIFPHRTLHMPRTHSTNFNYTSTGSDSRLPLLPPWTFHGTEVVNLQLLVDWGPTLRLLKKVTWETKDPSYDDNNI